MWSVLSLLLLLVCYCNEGMAFLAAIASVFARSSVTYSMRLYAYPSKAGQSKLNWNRHRQIRVLRANQEVQQALNDIIRNSYRIKAPVYPEKRLMMATSVRNVDLTHDLSHARISIAVRGNSVEKRMVFVWMCEHINRVRFALGAEISHWKRIPTIAFTLVDPAEEVLLINEVEEENEEMEKLEQARKAKLKAYKIANNIAVDDEEDDKEDYTIDYFDEDSVSKLPKSSEDDLFGGNWFGTDDDNPKSEDF